MDSHQQSHNNGYGVWGNFDPLPPLNVPQDVRRLATPPGNIEGAHFNTREAAMIPPILVHETLYRDRDRTAADAHWPVQANDYSYSATHWQRSDSRIRMYPILMQRPIMSIPYRISMAAAKGGKQKKAANENSKAQGESGRHKHKAQKRSADTKQDALPDDESDAERAKKRGGRRLGASNWRDNEVAEMLRLVKEHQPAGSNGWAKVEAGYNAWVVKAGQPRRDAKALWTKFFRLANHLKPTGDPDCPEEVVQAKRINRSIEENVTRDIVRTAQRE
ncbi:hypothetical protein WOLCODRAFT_154207 [Wolfiporia cocos MD-104 SS10]|uniref:DUF6818 domain-containing protein n=1 Tax=Wolfiporia cocos (strain MD-104) TaxID=742152 RepID=A0A2H3K215_WOLCO|nr:hypothetical protein WOLCODRAFT_154207 [Wolfiporia cocos MD-104 SS10]